MSSSPVTPENPLESAVLMAPALAPTARGAGQAKSADSSSGSWWVTLVVLAVVGGAGWFAYPHLLPRLFPVVKSKPRPERVLPVVTAEVTEGELKLYLNGLGTVTGFNTVTVRSRVEGELLQVAFKEGQMVKKGDLLAQIDSRPFEIQLKQAEAQLAKDTATFKQAEVDYDRFSNLFAKKAATSQELQSQKLIVEQNQAMMEADQSQIDNIKLQIEYCRIEAPIGGRIGLRTVDAGNMIRANEPNGFAVISQLQPISVLFSIPQDEISRVQKQVRTQEEPLQVDAFSRDFQTRLAGGTLAAVDNQVDALTGTVRLKAVFTNEDNFLFPNQFVNARLLVERLPKATLVPSAAVQRGPDFAYAYVMKDDSTVELRKITTGPTEGDRTSVLTGLKLHERVVIDGIDKLQNKAKVAERAPAGEGAPKEKTDAGNAGGKETSPMPSNPAHPPSSNNDVKPIVAGAAVKEPPEHSLEVGNNHDKNDKEVKPAGATGSQAPQSACGSQNTGDKVTGDKDTGDKDTGGEGN